MPFADACCRRGSGLVDSAATDGNQQGEGEREEGAENPARLQVCSPVVMRAVSYSMCWRYLRNHVGGSVVSLLWGQGEGSMCCEHGYPLLLEGYESRIVLSSGGAYIERSETG